MRLMIDKDSALISTKQDQQDSHAHQRRLRDMKHGFAKARGHRWI